MSPELFCPEIFGLKGSRRTKSSDCYALGMVMYEVLSGQVPFFRHQSCAVVVRVLKGQRPRWPREVEGMYDGVQEVLERCWEPKPDDRPRIEDVLRRLEELSRFWMPSSPRTVASPLMPNPPTRNSSGRDTEESTGESEASSPFQSSWMLPPKGDTDDKTPIPALPDAFTAPLHEVPNNQDPEMYVQDRSESDLEELVTVLDRVGWT
jgi:hypothetical protein